MKKLDNEALHCICNCWIVNVENLWEATAHLTQFPPEKFPVHTPASQADGVGGGPPPVSDSVADVITNQGRGWMDIRTTITKRGISK